MALTLVTPPAVEPVLVTDENLLTQLAIEADEFAGFLAEKIATARRRAELLTQRQLVTATWRLTLTEFPACADEDGFYSFIVPNPPLASVTSITYVGTDGATQTLDSALYQVDTSREPGRVCPAYGEAWPSTRMQPEAVKVTYTAGYGASGAAVPDSAKEFIRAYVCWLFEHRGDESMEPPSYLDGLLDPLLWGSYV